MKKILLYYALVVLFPAKVLAGKQEDGKRNGPVSEYVKQHVMPVLQEKRQAFDAFLTSTEKNQLASYREELQQLHENHRAFREQSKETSDINLTDNKEARDQMHSKMREVMQQVNLIAKNYHDQLDEIFKALDPQRKQWKSDISQLMSVKNAEEISQPSLSENTNFHYGMNGRFKMWSHSGFLLLDPSKNVASISERLENTPAGPAETMSIFPNPALNSFTLNFTDLPAENKLIVTDLAGKTIFEKENIVPSETIDCNAFNNGIYFVMLSSADHVVNEKLIVSH